MASVDKVNGRFKVRWRIGDKARSKTFDSREQANAYRVQIESDLLAGRAVTGKATLGDWAADWQANRQGLRATTRVRNESLFSNHIEPALGHVQLEDLTTPGVQAFVTSLTKKKVGKPSANGDQRTLAATTVREIYQELDKCLTAATHAKLLRDNPCHGITLPRVEHQEMHFLNHREVKALAEATDARYRALVYLLAYGGLRIGEAAALLPEDFDGKSVAVTKTVSEVRGKMVTAQPKTKAGRRVVPLPGFVSDELQQHLNAHPSTYLFAGRDGGQVRANVYRARQFKRAKQTIGRPEIRIHDLRHTAISLWISQGVDLLRIKKWAGHTSATFTLDRYGHLFEDENEAVLLRLDEGIREAQEAT